MQLQPTSTDGLGAQRDAVVLIHGLCAHPIMLGRIERWLAKRGYKTRNWSYLSLLGSIEGHAEQLQRELTILEERPDIGRIHLVTHSMGSIIARHALSQAGPAKLGRIVMLGPPNRGSHVASALTRVFGVLCKPLRQLADTPDSFVFQLETACRTEIGVIAAAYDRVVPVESTHLPGQADHVVVPSGHTSMLLRRDVAELVESFLENGRFCKPDQGPASGRRNRALRAAAGTGQT